MINRRKVCVVLVDRANYGRLKPVMRAVQKKTDIELQVIATGTMVLERFDYPVRIVESDGFPISGEIYIELEGSRPVTMAKSIGFATIEFASEFQRLKPDVVILIGDRYEALAAAIAAAYMNLCIVHIQGGEVSGSIDESARHAITKFAHFHVPATKRSAEYLIRMGERSDTILTVGCPASDIAKSFDYTIDKTFQDYINSHGRGANLELASPFQLVVFHPTTTEYGDERLQMGNLLAALNEVRIPTLLLWPNIDAGSDHISKEIRVFRDRHGSGWLRNFTNFSPENYLKVLANSACCIGNSSSFVRDASYFGTPVVLVGARQDGREHDIHVTRVTPEKEVIVSAIQKQLNHGRYPASALYGDGEVSSRIAEALVSLDLYIQKRLHYPYQTDSTSN